MLVSAMALDEQADGENSTLATHARCLTNRSWRIPAMGCCVAKTKGGVLQLLVAADDGHQTEYSAV